MNYFWKILVISIRKQDLDKKAEILWLYQHKVHSSLVSIHSCKMVYWTRLSYNGSLIVCVLFFCLFRVCWLSIFDKYLLVLTEKLQRVWILQKGHNQRLLWLRHLQPILLWSNLWCGPWYGRTDDAGGNTGSYFNCHSYRRPYCNYSIWVGTRYGNNFRPDELEVYYEVLAWNRAATLKKESIKNKRTNSNNNNHNKNINRPTKISHSKK